MNIYASLILFSVTVLTYCVITEVLAVLFRFTGLPDDRSRFQVISLLTGCGYTTKESELFLSSRIRRRLARFTMLFGYIFNITIVSAFINVFLSMKERQLKDYYFGLLIPMSVIGLIVLFARVPAVRGFVDGFISAFVDRMIGRQETFNAVELLENIGAGSLAVVTLHHIPDEYRGVSLANMNLKAETGIMVLLVEHRGKKPEAAGANTVFYLGDKLTVFGGYSTICRTFDAKELFSD